MAYVLATLTLVTAPLPAVFALAFATPFALSHGAAFLVSDALRRRAPRWMSLVIFPSLMVLAEFGMHRLTPFGSWAAAYTQVENLPLLQVASLAGAKLVAWNEGANAVPPESDGTGERPAHRVHDAGVHRDAVASTWGRGSRTSPATIPGCIGRSSSRPTGSGRSSRRCCSS
ncbi:MAG TPA: hypothetical protein PKC83_13800 [Gemmatimonadaceae bacterium]|nr:hypothetical protein [Gemmatimonadaceae bacterium]